MFLLSCKNAWAVRAADDDFVFPIVYNIMHENFKRVRDFLQRRKREMFGKMFQNAFARDARIPTHCFSRGTLIAFWLLR